MKLYLLPILAALSTFCMGYLVADLKYQTYTEYLQAKVAHYENAQLFDHSCKVSKITGAPLYQVLTGISYKGDR